MAINQNIVCKYTELFYNKKIALIIASGDMIFTEVATRGVQLKKVFLKISQNSQKNVCASLFFKESCMSHACNIIKKVTLVQVFSCESCEIFKRTFLTGHLRVAASRFVFLLLESIYILRSSNFCQISRKNAVETRF